MPRFAPELTLKTILVALSLAALICVGCGDDDGPAEAVAGQSEIEKFLAENPDADVDMVEEDDEEPSQ
tara:strand:- start:41877 stop:42080 length:204 start_codon:yes stop_codon:yes gene_type:complete